jgi:hypothetical protein
MDSSMNVTQTVWSVRLPSGEVRSGTLEQLDEALRAGHLSPETPVCAAGSDQWARLADVLDAVARGNVVPVAAPAAPVPAPPVAAPPASVPPGGGPALWQVMLADGQVRSGTQQQLEEAFRAGHLHADMQVLVAGAPGWVKLGLLMGHSAPPPAPALAVAPAPPPPAAPVQSARPPVPPSPVTSPPSPPGGDEIWQVRLADGQVRSGTRQQLEEAFRAGHIDGGALALAAGASDWVPLYTIAARLSSAPRPAPVAEAPPAPPAPVVVPTAAPVVAPKWQVQLSYQQLEEAVRVGLLGADSQVLAAGTDRWIRLGDLLGAQGGGST